MKRNIHKKLARFIRTFALFSILSALIFSYSAPLTAYADNGTAICSAQTNAGNNIGVCINRIYVISLALGGTLSVLIIVIAGYLYMQGGEGAKTGKNMLTSAITGLVILFGTYIFLNTINPDLTAISGYTLQDLSCTGAGSSAGQNSCTLPSGSASSCSPITDPNSPISVTNLQSGCFGSNAQNASIIANAESSNNASAAGDICTENGQNNPVSFGYFQINISANNVNGLKCTTAFDRSASGSSSLGGGKFNCAVTNQNLYNQCKTAALNPSTNISAACSLSNNGSSFSKWSTHTTCNIN